jgi:cell division protein FtsB
MMGQDFEDLKQLKSVFDGVSHALSPHPSFEQLVAYHLDPMPKREQPWIEDHIVGCQTCAERFKDILQLIDVLPAEPRALSDEQLALAWGAFQQTAGIEESPIVEETISEPPPPPRLRPPEGFVPRKKIRRLVIIFTLIALGLGLWSTYLWWTRGKLVRYYEEQERRIEQLWRRNEQLEQENQGMKQSTGARIKTLSEQVKQLTTPQVNWPIYDVFAASFLRRSSPSRINQLRLPASATGFTVILVPESKERFPESIIEIIDAKNQTIWRADGVKKNSLDGFTLTLNRSQLSEDRYTIKVFGKRADGPQLLDEYPFTIELAKP